MEYGCNTTNKFAFLSGDEDASDPEDILTKTEQAAAKAKLAPKAPATKKLATIATAEKKPIAPPPANKENIDGQQRRGPPRPQGEHKPPGQRGPRNTNENGPAKNFGDRFGENPRPPRRQNFADGDRPPRNGPPRPQNRDGDRRPPRTENNDTSNTLRDNDEQRPQRDGGRGPRGPPRGGRSDRVSGSDKTGVHPVLKKEGFGKGNWGTKEDELTGETEPLTVDGEKKPEGEKTRETSENVDQTAADEEAENIRKLTLEEWKQQNKPNQPQFNTRKAGEGGDQKIYQKLVPIKPNVKDDEEEPTLEDTHVKREPREKPLNIQVKFANSRGGGGGGRGERGGFNDNYRGGGGGYRGGDRGDRSERGDRSDRGERSDRGFRGGQGGARRTYNDNGPRRSHQPGHSGESSGGGGATFTLSEEAFPALGGR